MRCINTSEFFDVNNIVDVSAYEDWFCADNQKKLWRNTETIKFF
jgi:hypothetical protein